VTAGVIAERAPGFSMPGVRVEDGQDVLKVHDAVKAAVDRARAGQGPSLVEVLTYRFNEHSEGLRLGTDYRDAAEREAWMKRDPIKLFRARLMEQGIAGEATLEALDAEVRAEVEAAYQFAEESDFPAPHVAFKDLYTEPFGVNQ
jgi:pyruvate dehydrogenase E1 component alpha subunit